MLVLSRKKGQSIVIAHDIVVNVVDIGRGRVHIGITAPSHMPIHREEIYHRIRDEKQRRGLPVYASAELAAPAASCVASN